MADRVSTRPARRVSLREAAERVLGASADERAALIVDLHRERAEILYRIAHAEARIAVLNALAAALPRIAEAARYG